MNDINDKVYLIAMIETLINNNRETNLGDYSLEYDTTVSKIKTEDNEIATLAVSTRLKAKKSQKIVWGFIYHKTILEDDNVFANKTIEKIKEKTNKLHENTEEEKLKFILHKEGKRLYLDNPNIDPRLAGFFGDLQESKTVYPTVRLGGRFPKEAITELDRIYNKLLEKYD